MKTIRSAGVVIYQMRNNQPEYLVLLYPGGYWEFPKGKLEPGETDHMAAHREIKEETNLEVVLQEGFEATISYTFKDRNGEMVYKEVIFFVGTPRDCNVILSSEHRDYRWLTFPEAINYVGHDNARELLTKAHEFILLSQSKI